MRGEQQQNEDASEEDLNKSKDLYDLLVRDGLIQPLCLKKSCKSWYEREIRDSIDPSMAEPLIEMLKSGYGYNNADFEKLVCSRDELWELLSSGESTKVYTIDIERVDKELPAEQMDAWKSIKETIDPMMVDLDKFSTSEELGKLKKFLDEKKILTETSRARVDNIDVSRLRFEGKFAKYAKVRFYDNGQTQEFKEFLGALIEHLKEAGQEYVYESNMPFGTRETEAAKLIIDLREKNILKSGGLRKFKYGKCKEDLDKQIEELIKDKVFKNDKEFICARLYGLQGDLRGAEEKLAASLKVKLKSYIYINIS